MTRLTLIQRQAIDLRKEQLVPAAEKLIEDCKVTQLRKNDFGHSQLRNLIAVAMETQSPKVVENFIRYQMGRDSGKQKKNWSHPGAGGKPMGDLFLKQIAESDGAISNALKDMPETDDPQQIQVVQMELLRHFLGFASRYLKYLDLQRGK